MGGRPERSSYEAKCINDFEVRQIQQSSDFFSLGVSASGHRTYRFGLVHDVGRGRSRERVAVWAAHVDWNYGRGANRDAAFLATAAHPGRFTDVAASLAGERFAIRPLLYVLLIVMPTAGYLGASFSGDAVAYFGVPTLAWAAKDEALKEQFFMIHSWTAWVLVAAIALHVLAALKHLLINRDGVFERMWPR